MDLSYNEDSRLSAHIHYSFHVLCLAQTFRHAWKSIRSSTVVQCLHEWTFIHKNGNTLHGILRLWRGLYQEYLVATDWKASITSNPIKATRCAEGIITFVYDTVEHKSIACHLMKNRRRNTQSWQVCVTCISVVHNKSESASTVTSSSSIQLDVLTSSPNRIPLFTE